MNSRNQAWAILNTLEAKPFDEWTCWTPQIALLKHRPSQASAPRGTIDSCYRKSRRLVHPLNRTTLYEISRAQAASWVGGLGFPVHFVCVSAALYHGVGGGGYAAAIFSLQVITHHCRWSHLKNVVEIRRFSETDESSRHPFGACRTCCRR